MLFKCFLRGTKHRRDIEIREEGIKVAKEIQKLSGYEGFTFSTGGVDILKTLEDESFDGVILSNILDNIYPQDSIKVLREIKRILKKVGKALV